MNLFRNYFKMLIKECISELLDEKLLTVEQLKTFYKGRPEISDNLFDFLSKIDEFETIDLDVKYVVESKTLSTLTKTVKGKDLMMFYSELKQFEIPEVKYIESVGVYVVGVDNGFKVSNWFYLFSKSAVNVLSVDGLNVIIQHLKKKLESDFSHHLI